MEWEEVHKTIGEMSEWERGWYHALVMTVFFEESHRDDEGGVDGPWRVRIPVDVLDEGKPVICRYSKSGQQQHAESFYSPQPEDAPDLIEVLFDPKKFEATWMELDSEACLMYYRLLLVTTVMPAQEHLREIRWDSWEVEVACTEHPNGIPEAWENIAWPGEFATETVTRES
jgi:hypothetical protein